MKLRKKDGSKALDTLIGANTVFEGCIISERSVCVEGTVRGKIASRGEVIVGRQGRVEADIEAGSVVVGGQIIGNITAEGKLEITPTGRVAGDIEAATVSIAEGGVLDGNCRMITASKTQPATEETLQRQSGVEEEREGVASL